MKDLVKTIIWAIQTGTEGESTETKIEVDAEYYKKNNSHYLFYEEVVEGFEEKNQVQLKYKEGLLEMKKKGPIKSQMVFEVNKKHPFSYQTPYGLLLMEVDTMKLIYKENTDLESVIESEIESEIEIAYQLLLEQEVFSHNKLKIQIKRNRKD